VDTVKTTSTKASTDRTLDALSGCLLGTAVGDSVGLPAEGMRPDRIKKLYHGHWRHRFVFGRGMLSDDTEHAFFTAKALLDYPDDVRGFERSLAKSLKLWFLSLPAGIGLATLRACIKLCLGFPPSGSGVRSAGNGAAMRSAIIGAYFSDNEDARVSYVRASTMMTHTDSRALTGALAVANIAALAARHDSRALPTIKDIAAALEKAGTGDKEWLRLTAEMLKANEKGLSVAEFAAKVTDIEKGVGGYVYSTVPIAIYSWLRHYTDFRMAIEATLSLGGDTDTVGAITGALSGISAGEKGLPREWVSGIADWPLSVNLLRKTASCLAAQKTGEVAPDKVFYFYPGVIIRNPFFMLTVLIHGLRRLLPPY